MSRNAKRPIAHCSLPNCELLCEIRKSTYGGYAIGNALSGSSWNILCSSAQRHEVRGGRRGERIGRPYAYAWTAW
jgi:hypothetical protein